MTIQTGLGSSGLGCASPMLNGAQGSDGYFFTLTAGQIPATTWGGYQPGEFGSIDREPIDGHTLTFCATDITGGSITFSGNITELLAGLSVWVDGVEIPTTWQFQAPSTTYALLSTRLFFNGEVYFVEIK